MLQGTNELSIFYRVLCDNANKGLGHLHSPRASRISLRRLHEEFPYLEGEVRYACKAEYAQTCVDVLARRTRLAFLNTDAAKEAMPRILDIMQVEHSFDI